MKTLTQLKAIAKSEGKAIRKSRSAYSLDNQGGYRVIDTLFNRIECGAKYDMSIEDLEKYFCEE